MEGAPPRGRHDWGTGKGSKHSALDPGSRRERSSRPNVRPQEVGTTGKLGRVLGTPRSTQEVGGKGSSKPDVRSQEDGMSYRFGVELSSRSGKNPGEVFGPGGRHDWEIGVQVKCSSQEDGTMEKNLEAREGSRNSLHDPGGRRKRSLEPDVRSPEVGTGSRIPGLLARPRRSARTPLMFKCSAPRGWHVPLVGLFGGFALDPGGRQERP